MAFPLLHRPEGASALVNDESGAGLLPDRSVDELGERHVSIVPLALRMLSFPALGAVGYSSTQLETGAPTLIALCRR